MSACVLALAACGSDDDDGGGAGTASGGAGGAGGAGAGGTSGDGSGGTAGTSGTSGGAGGTSGGTGGTSGTSGGTGGMMAAPVMCGGTTCPTPMSAQLQACCVDDGDVCGQEIRGFFFGSCAEPAVPDDECESITLMGFQFTGCCTADGRCGIGAGIIFGEPCTSIEELRDRAADAGAGEGDGGVMFEGPEPSACTPD